jgi:hypothetical protein
MAFSETLKNSVKRRSHFTCCWCREIRNKVEVHHIKPQANGGSDTIDNAAPMCSNCHTLYGGNPELRKEIRARRDHWFELCDRQGPSDEEFVSKQTDHKPEVTQDASEFLNTAWEIYAHFGELTHKVLNGTHNDEIGVKIQEELSRSAWVLFAIYERLCHRHSNNQQILDAVRNVYTIVSTMFNDRHNLRGKLGPAIVAAEAVLVT